MLFFLKKYKLEITKGKKSDDLFVHIFWCGKRRLEIVQPREFDTDHYTKCEMNYYCNRLWSFGRDEAITRG